MEWQRFDLVVTDHAWRRWLERSRSRNKREAVGRLRQCLQHLQLCRPRSKSKRRRKGAVYYTGGGFVFVVRDGNQIVTVYPLSLDNFEVLR